MEGRIADDQIAEGLTAGVQSGPQLLAPSMAAVPGDSPPAAEVDLDALQSALISALAAVKGQQSASEQIEDAGLKLNGATVEIHTTLSMTMLPVVLNADAERILKTVLRDRASSLTLKLVPATPAAAVAPKKPRAAARGAVAEMVQKHPLVREAQRLFSAEISNVIDLREKE